MSCPQCQSGEIDSSGTCLNCGCQIPCESPDSKSESVESESVEKDARNMSGTIEVDNSEGAPAPLPQDDVPPWRKELSQRLQDIKKKKDALGPRPVSREKEMPAQSPGPQITEDPAAAALRAEIMERMKARKPIPRPQAPPPLQKTLQPLEPPSIEAKSASGATDPQKIQNLIDTVVSRKSASRGNPIQAVETPIPVIEYPRPAPDIWADSEGKLILLSRTLSGLVDLIFVVLCAGIFILAADYFSGIIVLDSLSIVNFSALFLLTYFFYSLFFLTSSNQTIGMMITDLRVVEIDNSRPRLRQLVVRCCGYLISLFGLGIGLLWSLASRENLCLHDRMSGTRVVRI